MASLIEKHVIPIEMEVTIHTHRYPDLAGQLEELALSTELTPIEVQDKIRETVQMYEMYLANGRIKPKALCS